MSNYLISFVLIGVLWLNSFNTEASAEGFDYYAQVNQYAKCEAVLNVMANILSESEQEFYQHELHHASIDSRIVALEFAKAGGYPDEVVGEIYATYLDEYRNQLKLEQEVEEFIAALRPHVKKCRRLNDMQVDIIQSKRNENLNQDGYLN